MRWIIKIFYLFSPTFANGLDKNIKEYNKNIYGRDDYEIYVEEFHKETKKGTLLLFAALFIIGLLAYSEGMQEEGKEMMIISIFVFPFFPVIRYLGLKSDAEEASLQMQMDFPIFINKVVFLVEAGYITSKAWRMAAESGIESLYVEQEEDLEGSNKKKKKKKSRKESKEIEAEKKKGLLYQELQFTLRQIESGTPETDALEEFARTLKIREISRAVSLIILNLKKGDKEVVGELRNEARDCFEMKKTAAKRLGERAETKLTLVSALMLFAVLTVLAAPAVISLFTSY